MQKVAHRNKLYPKRSVDQVRIRIENSSVWHRNWQRTSFPLATATWWSGKSRQQGSLVAVLTTCWLYGAARNCCWNGNCHQDDTTKLPNPPAKCRTEVAILVPRWKCSSHKFSVFFSKPKWVQTRELHGNWNDGLSRIMGPWRIPRKWKRSWDVKYPLWGRVGMEIKLMRWVGMGVTSVSVQLSSTNSQFNVTVRCLTALQHSIDDFRGWLDVQVGPG